MVNLNLKTEALATTCAVQCLCLQNEIKSFLDTLTQEIFVRC